MSITARKGVLVVAGGILFVGGALALSAPRTICHYSGARSVKARADILAIEDAITRYRLDRGALPRTVLQLATAEGTETPYLDYVPLDPWGHPYEYTSDGERYVILSFGADGAPGGAGEDADIDNYSMWDGS